MRHIYSLSGLTALIVLQASAVYAQEPCCRNQRSSHLYGTLALAGTMLEGDNLATSAGIAKPLIDYSIGYRASGALGYRLSPYLRAEMELVARKNQVSSTTLKPSSGSDQESSESRQDSYGGAINAYVDLHNRTLTTPYVGAGAGIFRIRNPAESAQSFDSQQLSITTESTGNAQATVFGYQFMAGVSREIKLGWKNPAEVVFGYRYFKTQDGEDKSSLSPASKFTISNQTHEVELGFRFNF
jgi:opacity protein-like surface antigen